MMPSRPAFLSVLFAAALFLSFSALAADAGAPGKPPEKPKEPEFKYSAWCAFRDLSTGMVQLQPEDPKKPSEHTRFGSNNWSGFGRRGMWTSIVLEMKNTTEKTEFKGNTSIRIEPLSGDGSSTNKYFTTYAQPFDIGPQTQKQYRFSVLCPEDGWPTSGTFRVTGMYNGGSFERMVSIHDLDQFPTDFVLVVSEISGSYQSLHAKRKTDFDEGIVECRVASVEPSELPTRWHDLMAANLIIIDGPPREALTETQWEALRGYVEAGGHVLITAGKDPQRLKGPIEELCGITANSMTEVTSLDGDFSLKPSPLQKEWKLPLVDVTVSPKGTPIIRRNGTTQVVESVKRYHGSGSVTFLAYSLSDPAMIDFPGRLMIPRSILSNERGRRLFSSQTEDDGAIKPKKFNQFTGYQTDENASLPVESLLGFRQTLDNSFANDTPVQLHSPALVMGFLLFYLMFAVPISYFVFGWLGRRELAWLFVPVTASVFSGIGYYIGHHGQVGNLTVNEVSVIEAGPGQPTGMARTFAAIYAPTRDDYLIAFPPVRFKDGSTLETLAAPNHLLNPDMLLNREIDAPGLALKDLGQSFEIDGLRIQYRSTRHLEVLHRTALGEGLFAKAERGEDNRLRVAIENRTGSTLLFPTLIQEGRALPLLRDGMQTLQAGESFSIENVSMQDSRWKKPDEAFFGQRVVFASARGKHIAPRVQALNSYMRKNIERFRHGAIVAWADSKGPALPLDIKTSWGNEINPTYEPITLLVIPLSQKKVKTIDNLPGALNIAYSGIWMPDAQIQWTPLSSSGAMMQHWTATDLTQKPASANDAVAYYKLELPKNHRDLVELGCKMYFSFDLAVKVTRGPIRKLPGVEKQAAMLDGTIYIDVFDPGDGARGKWKNLAQPFANNMVTGAITQVEKLEKAGKIEIPFSNPRLAREGSILIRVSFNPNDPKGVKYELQMKNIQHRIVER